MRSLSGIGLGDSEDISSAFDFGADSGFDTADYGGGQAIDWGSPTIPENSSGQLTAAQLANLIGGAAAAGSQVIRSTQSPSVIPGSNVIYNPATGQMVNASGVVTTTGAPAISAGISLSPILIVIALVAVVGFMGGKH